MKKALLLVPVLVPVVLFAQRQRAPIVFKDTEETLTIRNWTSWLGDRSQEGVVLAKGKGNPIEFNWTKRQVNIKTSAVDARFTSKEVAGKEQITFDRGTMTGNVILVQKTDTGSRTLKSQQITVTASGTTYAVVSPGPLSGTLDDGAAPTQISAGSATAVLPDKGDATYSLGGGMKVNQESQEGEAHLTAPGAKVVRGTATTKVDFQGRASATATDKKSGNSYTFSGADGTTTLSSTPEAFPLRTARFSGGVKFTLKGKDKKGNAVNMVATARTLTYDEGDRQARLSGDVKIIGDNSLTFGVAEAETLTLTFDADHKPFRVELDAGDEKRGKSTYREEKP